MKTVIVTFANKESPAQMKGNDAIKQLIIQKGFTFVGNCHCSGFFTNKFELKTTDGDIRIRARAAHFLISKPGKGFTKFPISELKSILDEIEKDIQSGNSKA